MNIMDKFSLRDRVVVITGGTGILGHSFVKAVAQAGAKVAIIGRNQERADERVKQANAFGADALAILADVLNEKDLINAKDQIMAKWGTIDCLVNAAGGNVPNGTIGPEDDLFEKNITGTLQAVELNLHGTIIPTHIFGKVIAEKGKGSIVNIASLSSHAAITRVLGYTVAKSGIVGYTNWMATELALRYGDGVRMNAIAPGVFLTEQNRTLLTNDDGTYTDRGQIFMRNTPYKRLGNPEELEGALVFLLSDASAFVNGETLYVDGGFTAWTGV